MKNKLQNLWRAVLSKLIPTRQLLTENSQELWKLTIYVVHHTYQPKEERVHREVIKHMYHSINTNDIKEELQEREYNVRSTINAKHRQIKTSLNIFFLDLEPSGNNKDVYNIRGLQNKLVVIEPPRRDKNIAQCTQRRVYGNTEVYSNRPDVCTCKMCWMARRDKLQKARIHL